MRKRESRKKRKRRLEREAREKEEQQRKLGELKQTEKWLRRNFWMDSKGMVESRHIKAVLNQALGRNVGNRLIGQFVRFAFPNAYPMVAHSPRLNKNVSCWAGLTYRRHNVVISPRTLKNRERREQKLIEDAKERKRTQRARRKSRKVLAGLSD